MSHRYSNALIHETSPYLLQHAHNPVQWYPWADEALALARQKQIPILVSIGYSACHWCHVMERESFENETTAAFMNAHFVNIKIDREERPDLDHIYMDAVQAISGSGGWPLNVFLTPEAKPFFGGTYYPPMRAFNRSSWMELLQAINALWTDKRHEAEDQAESLISHIETSNNFQQLLKVEDAPGSDAFVASDCKTICDELLKNADTKDGGFGGAPKFLQTFSINYLLAYATVFNQPQLSKHALFSLKAMLRGGIYDQLAGGISRYSTDEQWLVPHFEKMLYDNALLLATLCNAYMYSHDEEILKGISSTARFLLAEMKDTAGGFYTAFDADSEGEEGKFYTWTFEDIHAALGDDADMFNAFYGVLPEGNWEHRNILHQALMPQDVAAQFKMGVAEFEHKLGACRKQLLNIRNKRIRPGTDDKILLATNALLVTAFCKTYAALKDEAFASEAEELFTFIIAKFENTATGEFLHTYKNGQAKFPAFLDDYAYLVQACIALQEITGRQEYLQKAVEITGYVSDHFSDAESLFFKYTHAQQQDIVVRKTELYDGATPSANAVMAQNLLILSILTDKTAWRNRGEKMLWAMKPALLKYPGSFGVWSFIYLLQTAGIHEVVLAGRQVNEPRLQLLHEYLPTGVLQSASSVQNFPLLQDKNFENDFTGYLCRNYTCDQPVKNILDIIKSIKKSYAQNTVHNI